MVDLSTLPPLRDVIKQHNLRAEKKFGQNFLLDLNITDKIVNKSNGLDGVTVFEIGPGPGGLTRSLLTSDAEKVIAIEYDPRAVAALQSLEEAAGGKLTLHQGDALEIDLISLSDAPRSIVANLPYNIATPLLIGWLSQLRQDKMAYQSMTLMFQKEVAQRIAASVGSKEYGRLAVMCQWLCDVDIRFHLPPSAFTPPPKVTSSVVYFKPKMLGADAPSFDAVEKVTAAAFGQRRKMIRQSLKNYKKFFEATGLDETMRAENISPEKFIELARRAEEKGI